MGVLKKFTSLAMVVLEMGNKKTISVIIETVVIWVTRFHDLITTYNPSFGVIMLDNSNKSREPIFVFDESSFIFPDKKKKFFFSEEKLAELAMCIVTD